MMASKKKKSLVCSFLEEEKSSTLIKYKNKRKSNRKNIHRRTKESVEHENQNNADTKQHSMSILCENLAISI